MKTVSISSLLHKAFLLAERNRTEKYNKFQRGEDFNVFHLCKVDHYENMHSFIIAEFLNPQGSHGQGDIFLRLFIERADKDFAGKINTLKASVYTEYAINEGRLDILIVDETKKAIIIENKIYASDQKSQLKRYEAFAKKSFGDGNFRILYLTLNGSEASESSGKNVSYTPISYSKTILDWIDECIPSVYDKPFIRESMIQYQTLIKELTGITMDKKIENELLEEMMRSPEGVAAIVSAYPAWEQSIIKKHLFEPLEAFAREKQLIFSINDRFWNKCSWGHFAFEVQTGLSIVFEYERTGRGGFYYGIVDKRQPLKAEIILPGLEGGNDVWRYGWHYFDQHQNWTTKDIAEIAQDNGKFLHYLQGIVVNLLSEMKKFNII